MRLEYQILIAVAIDLVLGDPRWMPHPVRGIGRLALWLEALSRRVIVSGPLRVPSPIGTRSGPDARGNGTRSGPDTRGWLYYAAGLWTALVTYTLVGMATWGAIRLAGAVRPWAADAVSVFVIYTTVAARDLARHGMAVFRPLVAGDLVEARRRVGAIVGRDTQQLDDAGVIRAALESVAESTVDGVTAPLFFAVVAGPVGAMVYRAVNTLDSMFGHLDDRYRQFGWAAARIDDVANYFPARLTAPLICLAAALFRTGEAISSAVLTWGGTSLSLRRAWCPRFHALHKFRDVPPSHTPTVQAWCPVPATHALRILARDGRNHASPNSGLAEAAMAGALGVQLGGVNYYGGEPLQKPTIGEPLVPLSAQQIPRANALMFLTTGLFLAACLALRAGTLHLCHVWRAAG